MKNKTIIESKNYPKIIISQDLLNKKLFSKIFLPLTKMFVKEKLLKLILPHLKYPLYLRSQTSDILNLEEIFINGDYNLNFPKNVNRIIDAGANIGLASIYFSKIFKNPMILALEPEKSNFSMLKKNVYYYKNIRILNKGLWIKNAYLQISNKGKTEHWGYMVEEVKNKKECEIMGISIEKCMNIMGWNQIDLLKLDVEGSEKELFSEGYEKWLDKVRIIIIELHEKMRKGATESFYKAIKNYNFKEIKLRRKYAKHMRFLINRKYVKE